MTIQRPLRVRFRGVDIGQTLLEHGDAPMCCASGAFVANEAYALALSRALENRAALLAQGILAGYLLTNNGTTRIFDVEGLEIVTAEGNALTPVLGIYVEDWSTAGLDEKLVFVEGLDPDLYHLYFRHHVEGYRDFWRIDVTDLSILTPKVDVIVNAANAALSGGGGLDYAIHRAAGPGLAVECARLGRCAIGEAVVTGGHDIPVRHIVHAVGPAWGGGTQGEAALLARCHRRVFGLARELGAKRIALPALSCGAHRFPPQQAAEIAMLAAYEHVRLGDDCTKVTFCVPDPVVRGCYEAARRAV